MSKAVVPQQILLVGMMGSGKTTVGRILAGRLGTTFHDNDASLQQQLGGVSGELQVSVGTVALHAAEAAAVHRALAETAAVGGVVSIAASTIEDSGVRAALRQAGSAVWLRADPETLMRRIADDTDTPRPTFGDDMAAWTRTAAEARAPLFAEVADVTIDVEQFTPGQVAQRLLDALGLPAFGWLPGSFEGVVLDLDGLLVDTEVVWTEAKRMLYAKHGVPFSIQDHRAVLGTSEEYTAMVFARRFGLGREQEPTILREYLAYAMQGFAQGVPRRPGALELVTSLRGRVPLGLASNTRREIVTFTVDKAGLTGCFDVIVTGDEAEPKPAPGIYLEACRQLGIEPSRSVAVEDSPTGVHAAKAAGMTCIGVPSDPEHVPAEADCLRASVLELVEPAR